MLERCENCKHAVWLSEESGECTYSITMPNSYLAFGSKMPVKTQITNYTKEGCECWGAKDEEETV